MLSANSGNKCQKRHGTLYPALYIWYCLYHGGIGHEMHVYMYACAHTARAHMLHMSVCTCVQDIGKEMCVEEKNCKKTEKEEDDKKKRKKHSGMPALFTPEIAVSLRLDLPRGFGPSTFDKSLCGTFIDDFRFSNLAVYLASGDLSDSELDTQPGGGMGGINVKKGITLLGEWEMGKSCMFAPMKAIFSAFVLQVTLLVVQLKCLLR